MLTITRMKAHIIEANAIQSALETMAREVAEAKKPGSLTPYSGDGKSNNYWTFKGWELFEDHISVDFEFISQSPDSKTISIPIDCFPVKDWRE